MQLVLEKRIISDEDIEKISKEVHELGYFLDLHDRVESVRSNIIKVPTCEEQLRKQNLSKNPSDHQQQSDCMTRELF